MTKQATELRTISKPGAVLVVKEFSISKKTQAEIDRSLALGPAAADTQRSKPQPSSRPKAG